MSQPPEPPIVRRVRTQLERDLAWAVGAASTEATWARLCQDATNVLTVLWRNGQLVGSKPEEAFFVKCDRSTMTQSDIDNGRLIVEVGIAPVKPAEYVISRLASSAARADAGPSAIPSSSTEPCGPEGPELVKWRRAGQLAALAVFGRGTGSARTRLRGNLSAATPFTGGHS